MTLLGWSSYGDAQESPTRAEARTQKQVNRAIKGSPENGRISGVIVKLEPYRKEADAKPTTNRGSKTDRSAPGRIRLTINPLAVWQDYVRDQAANPKKADASKTANGENSVAVQGEPITAQDLVVVDIGPETRLATRFRSSTDETDRGSETVAKAEGKDKAPADAAKSNSKNINASAKPERRSAAKPPATELHDFKKGMFVEVEFRRAQGLNSASHVTILKPIGGSDTPAREAEPK